jgi:two-component sensor histidine kinase
LLFSLKLSKVKYIRIFTHPLFISMIIALFCLPFISRFFPKYKAEITLTSLVDKTDGNLFWIDINNDGESEKLTWFSNTQGKAEYKITSQPGSIIDQQEFNGEAMTIRNPLYIGDSNGDNFPEVYAFYHRNDSLLLSIVKYFSGSIKTPGKEIFITHVGNSEGRTDYNLNVSFLEDLDGDSIRDLIFSVYAGFPIIPRNIFIYNLGKEELIQSKFTGAVTGVTNIIDLNNDGRKELITNQYAPGNLHGSSIDGVSDNCARLLVYDSKLNLIFTPYLLEGEFSGLQVFPVMFNNQYYLASLFYNTVKSEKNVTLMLFNNKGELLEKKKIWNSTKNKSYYFIPLNVSGEFIHLLDNTGVLTSYNFSLETVKTKEYPLIPGTTFDQIDLDRDGQKEFIFYSYFDQFLVITRNNLSFPVRIEALHDVPDFRLTLKKNKGRSDKLCVQSGMKYFLIAYGTNPWYHFRFFAWLLVVGFMAAFIYFIQYLQRLLLKEKYRTERRMSGLQMLLIRNQVNPHFLFNAINTVSHRVLEKKPEEAHQSILRLSRLMRSTIQSSDRFSLTLQEELDTVAAYVEIVRSQSEKPFSFETEIASGVNMETQVPVMIIQNYVENALKHGIRALGENGKVSISITQDQKNLYIGITDNGVGREKASLEKEKTDSTGKGIGLMQQFFDEVNKYNEHKITCAFTDLYNTDGSPAGLRVELVIPLNIKYRIYE